MFGRRTVYAGSLVAVGALLDELVFYVLSKHPPHLTDRSVRFIDALRDRARF